MSSSGTSALSSSLSERWRRAVLSETALIQDAIRNLNEIAMQIVLIVDEGNKLIGTLSDGDIRRGLINGLELSSPIESIIFRNPLVAPIGLKQDSVLKLMTVNKIRQIPIVDEEGHIVGLHVWDQFAQPIERDNLMVIMAGGKGTRMRPHTDQLPKPMLRVAGKPMLEHIINRAKAEGFREFIIAVHYLGDLIEDYFADGSQLGVTIHYLREDIPLGTAGALSLIQARPDRSFLITNGDVMTDIRYGELLDFHEHHNADATMAVRMHEWQHPFGVVQMEGVRITSIREKPISRTYVNAGVYALSPEVLGSLARGKVCDMPSLFDRLGTQGRQIIAYPMHEPWLDVGRPSDLDLLNENYELKIEGL